MVSVCTVPARGGRSCEPLRWIQDYKPNTFISQNSQNYLTFPEAQGHMPLDFAVGP